MRIVLEMTVDEYLDEKKISRKRGNPPHQKDKSLAEKVGDCCTELVSNGVKAHKLKPVTQSINNKISPLFHDLLNQYVHNAYHSPSRSEEQTSELQSLMRISYAVFCLKKHNNPPTQYTLHTTFI